MPQNADHLTVVFSDIVGSSQLYASLGNERAKQKIDQAITAMSDIIIATHGQIIKTIGDEIMYVYTEPDTACEAAARMNSELKLMHYTLRSGISYGKIVRSEDNDLYGDTVNNAACLARTAQANQVLLDSNTYANLSSARSQCEYFDRITLKGQSEQSLVYRLNWEQQDTNTFDATMVVNKAISAANGLPTELQVNYDGNTYYVDTHSRISIGRDLAVVQICVKHKNASRKHCSLSYRHGKFILEDHSTNGTYLLQNGQNEVFLRRESTPLLTNGKISIGQPCGLSEAILEYHLD